MTTVHDLAADWKWMDRPGMRGFIVAGSAVQWEEAEYLERPTRGKEGLVRVSYVRASVAKGLRTVTRHLDPDSPVAYFIVEDPTTKERTLVTP